MKCPKCLGTKEKKIVYGMPDFENFNFEKYEVGGCVIEENAPTHWCVDCEEGFKQK